MSFQEFPFKFSSVGRVFETPSSETWIAGTSDGPKSREFASYAQFKTIAGCGMSSRTLRKNQCLGTNNRNDAGRKPTSALVSGRLNEGNSRMTLPGQPRLENLCAKIDKSGTKSRVASAEFSNRNKSATGHASADGKQTVHWPLLSGSEMACRFTRHSALWCTKSRNESSVRV